MRTGSPLSTRAAGVLLATLGLLPVVNWIAGGHDAPWFADRLQQWLIGGGLLTVTALSVGLVVHRRPDWWPSGSWQDIAARWRRAGWRADLGLGVAVAALCATVSVAVFGRRALSLDELAQLFQARVFASGHLWLPAPAHPGFTVPPLQVIVDGRLFGQFPAGGPAFLALGVVLGAPWLVTPAIAAAAAVMFARLVRRIEPEDGTAFAAVPLFGLSPFLLGLGGSMLNHVAATAAIIGAALALRHATADERGHAGPAFWCGMALGVAAAIRPLDALAFAVPSGGWLLWRAVDRRSPGRGQGRWAALFAAAAGVALPVAALLAINAAQTGAPLRFGYDALWGPTHAPGFHVAPWGPAHTPARGVELVNIYLLELQTHFLETPVPGMLFATVALLLARRATAFDRWMLAGSGTLLVGYACYWFNGSYLGPRFVLPLLPWLALWTARLPRLLRARRVSATVQRAVVAAGVVALAMGATALPARIRQYRGSLPEMRIDLAGLAASSGVRDAVVLVRESWGAQLSARLADLGVGPGEAQHLLRSHDACELDRQLSEAENAGNGERRSVIDAIEQDKGDSARLVRLRGVPDTAVRLFPGGELSPVCLARLRETQSGYTALSVALSDRDDGNIYIRDLHRLDTMITDRYPGRRLWLLTAAPRPRGIQGAEGQERWGVQFVPVAVDSARGDWEAGAPARRVGF
ncbi:MAG: hypothetical protein ACREL5_02865 [Gemmatimonadales bacterium]